MKSNQISLLIGVVAIGLSCPMAMADTTNTYTDVNTPACSRSITLDGAQCSQRTVLLERTNSSPTATVIEKSVSSPVVIERATTSPVVIEDRIVKQKHMFGFGIWPLFDFEVK